MTAKIDDEEIFEYIAKLQDFMLKGIRMLDDDGERAAIVYIGDEKETRELLRNERFWCIVKSENDAITLAKVDVKIDLKTLEKFNRDNGKWKYIGTFNEYLDILGLTEADSTFRDDNSDRRFRYLSPHQALEAAAVHNSIKRPSKEELLPHIRHKAEELINFCLDKQNEFNKLFPQIKVDFLKPKI